MFSPKETTSPYVDGALGFGIKEEQLTSLTRDHNYSALQQYGGISGVANKLKTDTENGISGDDSDLMARKNAFGSNTYPRKKVRSFLVYFKALAFGSMDPDEHPKLASLGMQLATELKGSFLGANVIGELLRANPNVQFWFSILLSMRDLVQKHLFSLGEHPEDLLERNFPVDFAKMAFVGAPGQGCLVYDLREAGPAQSELPKLTSREVLTATGGDIPDEDKFDVLVWRSRIPPYCDYIATYEKQKPRLIISKNPDEESYHLTVTT